MSRHFLYAHFETYFQLSEIAWQSVFALCAAAAGCGSRRLVYCLLRHGPGALATSFRCQSSLRVNIALCCIGIRGPYDFSMVQMFMHRRCSWTHVLFCFCIRVPHFLKGIGVDACMCMHELISEWYCLQYLRRVHGVVSMCLVQLWWVIRLAPINQERAALEYAPSHTGEMFPCYAGAAFRPAFQTSLTRRLTQSVEPAWWNKEKERISIAAVASLLT